MITSLKNNTIKEIVKLKQKRFRDEKGLFLIEGFHLVEEAHKKHIITTIITTLDDDYEEDTLHVSADVMKKLAFTKTPQPIMAVCKKELDGEVNYNEDRYILLDHLQDPGNVGTILRTALAFGYKNILLSNDSVDIYNDKVLRATQGALFSLSISYVDMYEVVSNLQDHEVKVYATALKDAKNINEFKKPEKIALVLGNESNGVSKEVLDKADGSIIIPIEEMESLNVAIAGAIVMYHFKYVAV